MRPCTRRIVSAVVNIKATSLDADLVEHAPWCRTAPDALPIHIKPLGRQPRWISSTTSGRTFGFVA